MELVLPVYLVHWDAPEWCASSTRSVLASEGVQVVLSVIDNGQTSGEALVERVSDEVRILAMGMNRGYAGGVNAALEDWQTRDPDGELCVVGSHDLHVRADTLARLVEVSRICPRAGIVAPVLVAPRRVAGGRWNGRRSWEIGVPESDQTDGERVVERQWASGTCLLLRRACVDEVGCFDERFGSYMEDVDYGLRANDLGWRVLVVTSAHAWGLGTVTTRLGALVTANTIILAAKRRGIVGALQGIGLFALRAAGGLAGAAVPWWDPDRRGRSLHRGIGELRGIGHVVASGLVHAVLREQSGTRAGRS